MTARIRLATIQDAKEILNIYRPYIKDTCITFEYEVPSLGEFTQRIRDISREYPYLVCEIDGRVVGYAYAHRQLARAAYQWNAELSVYVDQAYVGHKIGGALYGALLEILACQNVQNVYGLVTSPNPGSQRLHEKFGFGIMGVCKDTGYKNGKWHDVIWFEKKIGPHSVPPKPFEPVDGLAVSLIKRITESHEKIIKKQP